MSLKPKNIQFENEQPEFLRDAKNLEWTVGNITLDSSKLSEGQIVKGGTAVFKNTDSGFYELVEESTPETMTAPVLTGHAVKIDDVDVNEQASALRKASVYEELLTGATDNFKKATQGRITFDV
ncbi:hypothetical protein [Mammaliicoccus lentus]|uniref:hypothetical protein n=1 Tax=Mammaliicoccus lentus TaxID=42858 RepID=UPI001071A256|nr:hypothetical protein [Mammaliicoccus lentus]MBF0750514.1 hypothetical protein [Mammaliicoccus lentus]TFU56406.1 hypothetical protein E4T93_14100 [Mammaliicoccus lentus]